jgi:hypothetical protein
MVEETFEPGVKPIILSLPRKHETPLVRDRYIMVMAKRHCSIRIKLMLVGCGQEI